MRGKDAPPPREVMECRACGEDDRASEGYPCQGCGTFICLICTFKDVVLCRACAAKRPSGAHRGMPGG
jgi:hypothetical protein